MGLLDDFNMDDPKVQGLLAAGAQMMQASGPSRMPVSFGQVLAQGFGGGMQAYQGAKSQQQKDAMDLEKLKMLKLQELRAQTEFDGQQEWLKKLQGGGQSGAAASSALGAGAAAGSVGPTMQNAARMDSIPQSTGGLSSLTLNDLAEAAARKIPGAKELFDIKKYQMDGVERKPGSAYDVNGKREYIADPFKGFGGYDAGTNTVKGVNGYNELIAGQEGAKKRAEEEARARLDPFYSTDAAGNKVLKGSRLDALGGGFSGVGATGTGGTVIERNQGDIEYDKDQNKELAARATAISKAGFSAPSQIAKLNRINQLLADHDGNKFSGNAVGLSQIANSMGIKIDSKLGNKEAAMALSNEIALSLRDPSNGAGMPGAMSDSDRAYLSQMSPNLGQSADGRKQMIEAGIAVQNRNQQIADMARKYAKKYGKVNDDFYGKLSDWSERNPLFGK